MGCHRAFPAALLLTCLVLVAAVATVTESKRVLVLPMPFTSHTKYQTNVARALATMGHQVWLTMPTYLVAKGVLDTTNLTVVQYDTALHVEEVMMTGFRDAYFKGENEDWPLFLGLVKDHCQSLLTNQSFFAEIRALKPDFVIIDNIPGLKTLAVLPYRLGVPFAFLGSGYEPIATRIPFTPATTPVPVFPFTDRMTFPQRLVNVLVSMVSAVKDMTVYPDAVSRYAPEMPELSTDMLAARAELWLVEMDHVLDYPRSSLPHVKLIGGTATGPAKPLKPPFKDFMDGAGRTAGGEAGGVVVVSFGSYILDLPKDISDKIFAVLMELPFKSVFRSNVTSPDPAKILTSTWLPQNDLLGHPNVRAFVSHSGKNGQYEALFHAVPVIAVPIFADQRYNAERLRSKGFAETVDIRSVTPSDLKDVITKVATGKAYKEAISKASEIFRIEFGVPMDRAAFWLDHVMKYGGAHMRSAGLDMPFYQFLGLDILLCYFAVVAVVVWLVLACLSRCCKALFSGRKRKTE